MSHHTSRKHRRHRNHSERSYETPDAYFGTDDQSFYDYNLDPYVSQASASTLPHIVTASYNQPVYSKPLGVEPVEPLPSSSDVARALAQWNQPSSTIGYEDGFSNNMETNEEALGGEAWAPTTNQERERHNDNISVRGDEDYSGTDGEDESDSGDSASSEAENIPDTLHSTTNEDPKGKGKGKQVSFGTAQQAYVKTHYTHEGRTSKPKTREAIARWMLNKEPREGPRHAKRRGDGDPLDIEEKYMTAYQPPNYGTTSGNIATGVGAALDLSMTPVAPGDGSWSAGAPAMTSFASQLPTTAVSGGTRSRVISYKPSEKLMKAIRKSNKLSTESFNALENWRTSVSKEHDTLDFASWMQKAGFGWNEGGPYKSSSRNGELSQSVRFTALLDGISELRGLEPKLRREVTKDSWDRHRKYYYKHINKKQ